MTLTRRSLLLAVLTATACSSGPPAPVSIAAGEDGGFYLEFSELLAAQLRARGLPATTLRTGGSIQNIQLVRNGRATLGMALADVADGARRGFLPAFSAQAVGLSAIGRVYENYMQLVVRAEDQLRAPQDLAGRVVSLGAAGSGAVVLGERLLIDIGVVPQRLGLRDAVNALEHRRIDALLWSGGIPTPALAELAARRPIRLLSLGAEVARLQTYGPAYRAVVVPAGVYGAPATVTTIGVANLIVCDPELSTDIADATATTLVTAAEQLVPRPALGTQYLDLRSLIGTGSVPLHPGARAAYRRLHG